MHTPRPLFLILCALVAALALAGQDAAPARADALSVPESLTERVDPDKPWNFAADRLLGRHDANIVEAWGDVVLSQGDNRLQADYARYFRDTGWVLLRGNVTALWQGDRLAASEAEFDLKNQVGWLRDGELFVAGPHLYFSGEYIKKDWGDSYAFKNAKVTACDGEVPAWSFTAEEGDITLDGYARLWSASFRIKDRAVLGAPYLTIPVKTRRTSGFLNPEVGASSLLGFYANVPYFWAIDDDRDMTFYQYAMTKRGYMQGIEHRHHTEPGVKGLWRGDWLYDKTTALDSNEEPDPLDDDGLVRSNRNRYWWRSKFDGYLADRRNTIKLDIDLVSDQNYLREFGSGVSGYRHSRDQFLDEFGRDINENDQNRTSSLLAFRSWDEFGLAGLVEYNQAVDLGHGNDSWSLDSNLQKLPEVTAYAYKQDLPWLDGLPLEFEALTQATNFYRREGTRGERVRLIPRLSATLASDYGSLIPSFAWRQNLYAVERFENQPNDDQESHNTGAGVPEFSVDAYTELFRVFDWDEPAAATEANAGQSGWTRIKHSVQPRLSYLHRPHVDQSKKPYFNDDDRIPAADELTYSLTNVLTRKRRAVYMTPGQDPKPAVDVDYLDFVRFRLEQSYDFREAGRDEDVDEYERRPLGDLMADLVIQPGDYFRLVNRTWFSFYLGDVTEHEHYLEVDIPRWGGFSFGFDFQRALDEYTRTRSEISALSFDADLNITEQWSVFGAYRYDFEESKNLERTIGVGYRHQCYDLRFIFSQTPLDDRIELQVNLSGISLF